MTNSSNLPTMASCNVFQPSISTQRLTERKERCVIGIYGIPGVGKTHLLNHLRHTLSSNQFEFFEGSDLIASVVDGGLERFAKFNEDEKKHCRQLAIKSIDTKAGGKLCRSVVIMGHYMFWDESKDHGMPVMTSDDLQTYTHILYLDVPADVVWQRCRSDTNKNRPEYSVSQLDRWIQQEKVELRRLCYESCIAFSVISSGNSLVERVISRLKHFDVCTEAQNSRVTQLVMEQTLPSTLLCDTEALLIFDADKTLTSIDTGEKFWEKAGEMWPENVRRGSPLRDVFRSNLRYTYAAFIQAMLLYEDTLEKKQFDEVCTAVASATTLYPEFISLLQTISKHQRVKAVVITCGLRQVWEEILKRERLSENITVIGGGQLRNGYVVTGKTKAESVSWAKSRGLRTIAFGDSILDLDMLKEADRAIVVVGEEKGRSKGMEMALRDAIEDDGLQACQVILPNTATPRLSSVMLPIVQPTDHDFVQDLLRCKQQGGWPEFVLSQGNARNLLMTPMRDVRVAGPTLRDAHHRAGFHLAMSVLPDICGIEQYQIPHVQGQQVAGYCLLHEQKSLIVPLMRAGEPMAFGVSDALPRAMFLHANRPDDIRSEHLHGCLNLILVDAVVNTGKSLTEFTRHIRKLHATIRILVMVGVLNIGAMSRLMEEPSCSLNFKLIALRKSTNQFTGRGATDTGNRLFNTLHLE